MKPDYDTIVVGAGKFGRVIARTLIEAKHRVAVFDNAEPLGASKASGGLIKPSWLKSIEPKELEECVGLLDRLYGVEEIPLRFMGKKVRQETAFHVCIPRLLNDPKLEVQRELVSKIQPGVVTIGNPKGANGTTELTCTNIIVAAGVWCKELIKVPGLYGKRGVSFVFPGQIVGFVQPWAPYKQVVAHNHDDQTFWAGDGTAILPDKWTIERQRETELRVAQAVHRNGSEARQQHGIRPFVDGVTNNKPCLFKKMRGGIYITTGAGKSGMAASAWCARKLRHALV